MPRRPRIIILGVPLHLIQRGNNRQSCFYTDEDYCGQGEKFDLLSHHSVYQGLGRTSEERQSAYRELFRHELSLVSLTRFVRGNQRFKEEGG